MNCESEYQTFLDSLPAYSNKGIPARSEPKPCCTLVIRKYPGIERLVVKNCSVDRNLQFVLSNAGICCDIIVDSSIAKVNPDSDIKSLTTTQFPLVVLSRESVAVLLLEEICRSGPDQELFCTLEDSSISPDFCHVCGCCKSSVSQGDPDICTLNPLKLCATCNILFLRQ